MRHCLWISVASVVLAGAGVWWYFDLAKPCCHVPNATTPQVFLHQARPLPSHDGDAESCDLLEPLRVEDTVPPVPTWDASTYDVAMPRVVLAPDMQQPPRPDVVTGQAPHMPYADEEETPFLSWTNVQRVLEFAWSRLNVFGSSTPEVQSNPAEESETAGEQLPKPTPTSEPEPDYHRNLPQHCPYHGGCPYPYYRR
jgi:hypothetical protein